METGRDLGRAHHPNSGCGEFETEGHAIEAVDDLDHRRQVFRGDSEPGRHSARSLREQAHGVMAHRLCHGGVGVRQSHRSQLEGNLARHPEEFAAGGDQLDAGRFVKDSVREAGDCVHDVLTVVENQELPGVAQPIEQGFDFISVRPITHPDRRGDCVHHPGRIGDLRQFHQPNPIREAVEHLCRELDREAGLAGASDTGDGKKSGAGEQLLGLGELLVAAHEARHLCRKVVGDRIQRSKGCGDLG